MKITEVIHAHFKKSVTEDFDKEANAYKVNLIKTMPQILDLLSRTGKGWMPSEEQMLAAIETGYQVMKRTGDIKQAGLAVKQELNTLYQNSQQDVTENTNRKHYQSRIKYEDLILDYKIDGATVDVRAIIDDKQVGYVIFLRDGKLLIPDDLAVDEEYRGRGIAKKMYDWVKSLPQGFRIIRSGIQTTMGKRFWDKNRGESGNVWEELYKSKLSYIGNCTNDDVIEHLFGNATVFAQAVEEYGDDFELDDLVVKYDPESDIHSFYYKQKSITESTKGVTPTGYTWAFEHGGEVPWKTDVEVNTFIRVKDSKGKTVLGVWADVYRDDVEIQYSEVFDKKLRGKGIYTDFLKELAKHYNIISDQDQNNAARNIYKKLGADYNPRSEKHTLRRASQGVAEDKPDKKTIKSLEKHYSGYDQDEEYELQDYTGGDYGRKSASRVINKPLGKEKGVVPPAIASTVAKLDAATTRHVTPRELTVYYGTGPKRSPEIYKYGASIIKNIKPKSVPPFEMINHAYTSTTLDSSIADNFSVSKKVDAANYQEHTLTIKVPKGFKGAYVGHLSAMLDKYHGDWDELEFILPRGTRFTILPNPTIKKHTNPREPGLTLWQFNWQAVVANTAQQGVAEGSENNKISFQVQKGKNKFATTLTVDNKPAGVYQYDANTGRSIAEVYSEYKGKGFGKILVLHAIYTAALLGLNFQEDDSRTAEYDNVLDSLSNNGYIVDDDGYWYVTDNGEKFLKKSLKQGVAEAAVDEMALSTYKTMGDFTKQGPFTGADKKLVPHEKNIEKATKFFEQTPYDFRLFFSNIPGTGKYREYGPMDLSQIKQIFGKDAEEIIAGSENAITVVYVGNKGDRKVMLTPWMMAHRFGHAIQSGARKDKWNAWSETEKHFFNSINNTLEEYYGKAYRGANTYRTPIKWDMTPEYNALFNAIGTQRSSRIGEIKRPYEFLYELFAQYLGTGKVIFNPLPANLTYGRKVWGNPTKYMNIKPELRDEATRKEVADRLAYDMELMFNDVLAASVGKIFVM